MAISLLTFGIGILCAVAVIDAVPSRMMSTDSSLYLQVVEAGKVGGRVGPKVTDGSVVCPTMYPEGFSITCEGAPEGSSVTFAFNGRMRREERRAPYTIAGDRNNMINPWTRHGAGGVIRCSTATGAYVEANVAFKCDGAMDEPSGPQETMAPEMMPKPTDMPMEPEAPAAESAPEMMPEPTDMPMEPEAPATESAPEMMPEPADMPMEPEAPAIESAPEPTPIEGAASSQTVTPPAPPAAEESDMSEEELTNMMGEPAPQEGAMPPKKKCPPNAETPTVV